ncbi:hypothetical protein Ahy_A04g020819 [Arachis hypogaea]|uniref:Uncharacterized protein n=1 Tax=Arachis hypogaea TaxID=3818 RepID=A0A445DIK3_ARAHY|nr:hypothetical protein Ahy_A04g020819 [Arachis hypogaea]
MEFPPISDESLWPKWYGTMLYHNPIMCRKDTEWPMSTRFRNDMDEIERHKKRCGLCSGGNPGSSACAQYHTVEAEPSAEAKKDEDLLDEDLPRTMR